MSESAQSSAQKPQPIHLFNKRIEAAADFVISVPQTDPLFAASTAIVPLQLLAYSISCERGIDVDKPRNLAKSVTVE